MTTSNSPSPSSPSASFSWLHLSDLHQGMTDQGRLWPTVQSVFLDDLAHVRAAVGPWDLVLFTGDLTQRGAPDEFTALGGTLDRIWRRFTELTASPLLLAVPGNHDLIRPNPKLPEVKVLNQLWGEASVRAEFWRDPASRERRVVAEAFAPYESWWDDWRPAIATRRGLQVNMKRTRSPPSRFVASRWPPMAVRFQARTFRMNQKTKRARKKATTKPARWRTTSPLCEWRPASCGWWACWTVGSSNRSRSRRGSVSDARWGVNLRRPRPQGQRLATVWSLVRLPGVTRIGGEWNCRGQRASTTAAPRFLGTAAPRPYECRPSAACQSASNQVRPPGRAD
ncbi:MAG: metallophosphoesterase [Planctomycetes bacterium]|nr:metallophosphoesterase [Planctomycetota bacterium]